MVFDPAQVDVEALTSYRQRHLGRLFLRAHRDFTARAVALLRARGHAELSVAHTALLANLDVTGTRISLLAERAGMTKQSMGQLVQELERQGYVTRAADPTDQRASLVTFTEAGWRFLTDAAAIKSEIETAYRQHLGDACFEALETALTRLLDTPPASPADPARPQ